MNLRLRAEILSRLPPESRELLRAQCSILVAIPCVWNTYFAFQWFVKSAIRRPPAHLLLIGVDSKSCYKNVSEIIVMYRIPKKDLTVNKVRVYWGDRRRGKPEACIYDKYLYFLPGLNLPYGEEETTKIATADQHESAITQLLRQGELRDSQPAVVKEPPIPV